MEKTGLQKAAYWGKTEERKQRKEYKAWVRREEQRREQQKCIVISGRSCGPSPFRPPGETEPRLVKEGALRGLSVPSSGLKRNGHHTKNVGHQTEVGPRSY